VIAPARRAIPGASGFPCASQKSLIGHRLAFYGHSGHNTISPTLSWAPRFLVFHGRQLDQSDAHQVGGALS